jgi:hypothetical protein
MTAKKRKRWFIMYLGVIYQPKISTIKSDHIHETVHHQGKKLLKIATTAMSSSKAS